MNKDAKIFIAGHRGMVGAAIVRKLQSEGYHNIILRTHSQLDLTNQAAVRAFFQSESIDCVVLAAAKVGGIQANNTLPAEFIYQNLMIETNVIHQAYEARVEKLLFLGSSCIYPKQCAQPIKEEYLLTGPLEATNEPYAIAKIAGIKMCESYNRQYGTQYQSVMPTNLYGPGDSFDLTTSHVLPALLRKFHLARLAEEDNLKAIQKNEDHWGPIPQDIKSAIGLSADSLHLDKTKNPEVVVWGTGNALREFLHVDDMAAACVLLLGLDCETQSSPSPSFYNVGTGKDITISGVAKIIQEIVGFTGQIIFDPKYPDGTPRKVLDISAIESIGWSPDYSLRNGLRDAYEWYTKSQ